MTDVTVTQADERAADEWYPDRSATMHRKLAKLLARHRTAHSGEGRSNGAGERGETAWLIERDNSGPEYACGRGWTRDHRDALRFLSETDAANFASGAYKMVWTGEVAEYFDWHDFTRIAEHRWG